MKHALAMEAGPPELRFRGLVWPSNQTATREYFGFRIILGGLYEPTAFEDETWINVACVSQDPRVSFDSEEYGSRLMYVHALVYEMNDDGTLNTDTSISTADTEELDEGICDVSQGVDTTFIEIPPRTFEAAVVSLISVARTGQYVEVVENVERMLTR